MVGMRRALVSVQNVGFEPDHTKESIVSTIFKRQAVKFPLNFPYNTEKQECDVTIELLENDTPIEDLAGDWEDPKQLAFAIETGSIFACTVRVTARFAGLEGSDVLGGVLYKSDLLLEQDTIHYHSMVENALEDLAKQARSMFSDLKPVFQPTSNERGNVALEMSIVLAGILFFPVAVLCMAVI